MRTRLRLLLLLVPCLPACGYGVRGEVGPTWIQDQGYGGTVQVTGLLPVIAGSGLADHWTFGGWATVTEGATTGGLLFGTELAILPGGVDQPRSEPREGLGGSLRFQPRYGTDGLDFGGGLALVHGRGETVGKHSWSSGGGKLAVGANWRDVAVTSFGGAFMVNRNIADGFGDPGPWRFDALFLAEWLKATD